MKMNKGRRHELKMRHFKRRLKNLNLPMNGNHNCYRTSGKPCSCYICSTDKYKHNGLNKIAYKELLFQMSA
jgi:7-cyano-7-deazaguanine synthase in queuosine biosynthesis